MEGQDGFFFIKMIGNGDTITMDGALTWIGILICIMNSALFSGLTIGLFGLSRIRLEAAADLGDEAASKVVSLRKDANYLLATLLWGNVAANVCLTMLTDSILSGVSAFLFSTFVITLFGEIVPQAYFSRNTLKVAKLLIPTIRLYEVLLFPAARPTGWLLDKWLGKEAINYFHEEELRAILKKHAQAQSTDIGRVESIGASNFLGLDDIRVKDEGEILDPGSILTLPVSAGIPVFPEFKRSIDDPFLKRIVQSQKKWAVITDPSHQHLFVIDINRFIRRVIFEKDPSDPVLYCHRPILVTSPEATLGQAIQNFKIFPKHKNDDVIDLDLILYWSEEKRIITGADILGRLFRGIVNSVPVHGGPSPNV